MLLNSGSLGWTSSVDAQADDSPQDQRSCDGTGGGGFVECGGRIAGFVECFDLLGGDPAGGGGGGCRNW